MRHYFVFKGINSKAMGIWVSAMPEITKPSKRENQITIPGRNGVLHISEDTYENYTKDVECSLVGRNKKINYDEIIAWLDGAGDLVFSSEPDKTYKAIITNQIPISDVVRKVSKFLVQFDVFPFKYSTNAIISHADDLTLTAPTTINNRGTVYSQPTITVYGSGNITLTINDTDYELLDVFEQLTIDSEMMEVYKGTTNANNKYSAMDFPRFEVGQNSISWSGTVTKVEIEPKWRWL